MDSAIRFRIIPPSAPSEASDYIKARFYDLSVLGLRLMTNTVQNKDLHVLHPTYTTNEQCRLEIEIPDNDTALTLMGTAIWYDHKNDDQEFTFEVGVQFLDLSAEEKERVKALVKSRLTSRK